MSHQGSTGVRAGLAGVPGVLDRVAERGATVVQREAGPRKGAWPR